MRHKESVDALFRAIAQSDKEALRSLVSDEVVWWVPQSTAERGILRPLAGRDSVVELLGNAEAFFRPGSGDGWTIHHLLAEDEFVAAHVSLSAVTTSSGRDYDNHYHYLFRFEDGRIAEAWEHVDTAYAYARFAPA